MPASVDRPLSCGHPAIAIRARLWRLREPFDEADASCRASRAVVRAPRIMSEVYRGILNGMVARGFDPPRPRVRVGRMRLLGIILRNAII